MKKAIIALLLVLTLSMLPILVLADPDPFSNIKVWPRESWENLTGQPLVTTTPADMHIFTTGHNAHNVWLLLALNDETYDNLEDIAITDVVYGNGTLGSDVTYYLADFAETELDPSDGHDKIPVISPDDAAHPPVVDPENYPGCWHDERYEVSAVKDKIKPTDRVYYSIQYCFHHVTTVPTNFTITVNAPGAAEDLKVLVLGLGRYSTPLDGEFDNKSAYTQGSLIVIPELATILLATASIAALGIYKVKRRK